MPQVDRMIRSKISILALGAVFTLPLPLQAGGFRSGTYQTRDNSSSTRNVTSGMEEIRSERTYSNNISGSSQLEHLGMTLQGDGFQISRQGQQLLESNSTSNLSRDSSAAGLNQAELIEWRSSVSASANSSADHGLVLETPGLGLASLINDQAQQGYAEKLSAGLASSQSVAGIRTASDNQQSLLQNSTGGQQLGVTGTLELRVERGGQNADYAMKESGQQRLHSIERFTGSSVYTSDRSGQGDLFAFD